VSLFIESPRFTAELIRILDDDFYAALQAALVARPQLGTPIPGCGGLRKARLPDPRRRKGKRGGIRVVYLHVPLADWFLMVNIYDKDRKEDLSAEERKILTRMADEFTKTALKAAGVKR
jgi:hypothetical protein